MQKSSFFNSVNGDRKYKAEEWAAYFASFIGNGVFPDPSTNLMVEANTDMTVTVKAGKAWINGYFYLNTDDLIVQLDNADGVLKRIDRIVVRWSLTNRSIAIAVKKGTFASSPVAKALQRDADAYELALADVLVNNGVIQISQANITDRRQNSSLCGLVTGVVDKIDASGLFAQYEQIFNDWFSTIEDVLDDNAAANLLNLINAHKADFVAQPANGGTTGGTATAYTCTSNPAPTELADKIGVVITAHTDSGSNPTLNWNALGAKAIKKPNGNAATLKSGGVYTLRYNATSQNFILQGEGASGNATASDLLSGKTASTDAGDIVGTMANRGAINITPSTVNQAIPAGYHNGNGVVYGNLNLAELNVHIGATAPSSPANNHLWIDDLSVGKIIFSDELGTTGKNVVLNDVLIFISNIYTRLPIGSNMLAIRANAVGLNSYHPNNLVYFTIKQAYKWNGSKWVPFAIKSYVSGSWKTITGSKLYSYGERVNFEFTAREGSAAQTAYTFNTLSLDVTLTGSKTVHTSIAFATPTKVDLTGINKLIVDITNFDWQTYGRYYLGVSAGLTNLTTAGSSPPAGYSSVVTVQASAIGVNQRGLIELDVSALSGEYHIGFTIHHTGTSSSNSQTVKCNVHEVKME